MNTCRAILISVVAPNFRLNRIESGYNYIHNLEEHRMATSEEILYTFLSFFATPVLQNVKRILLTRGTRTFTKMNLVLLESRKMIVATHAHKKLTHMKFEMKMKNFRIVNFILKQETFCHCFPKKYYSMILDICCQMDLALRYHINQFVR